MFAYPLALALLCAGAGLLVDRASGRFLPLALLPCVGAAALIAISQLSTYITPLARATPYLLLAAALAGFALAAPRLRAAAGLRREGGLREAAWPAGASVLAYLLALAPVLLSARASFSSFMALSDSAVHMLGGDYLIHHGQDYAHVDLRNSYGRFVQSYYGTGYPSGADTLFGGSALLLGLPLIWCFQPFNGFVLALCAGPAWLLARAAGLRGAWAGAAALSASVPALVYGYELIGSIKELTALAMILALGVLVVEHRRWLTRSPRHALPVALLLAAGVSALGVGFGAWALAAGAVLLVALARELRSGRAAPGATLATVIAGALALLIAAWPTWAHVSASLNVAQNIASTGNPGNLPAPLKWTQVFGVWLRDSYKQAPAGAALAVTGVLIALTIIACSLGALQLLLRVRRFALASWIALMLLAWIVLSNSATTWVDAKALVLTCSVVVLLAWAGVAALVGASAGGRESGRRRAHARARAGAGGRPVAARSGVGQARAPARARWGLRALAAALALALAGGALASDAAQYHSSSLAPTARYEELARIDKRFAGRGPTLFTDFDEYSLYVLRKLDVGGPDFVYPPPALASLADGYGSAVNLNRASPRALAAYPLIVTRRDPSAPPPPVAYALAWRGVYYDVWRRRADYAVSRGRPGAMPAVLHIGPGARRSVPCAEVRRAARTANADGFTAIGAVQPETVRVPLDRSVRPPGWGRERAGFAMKRAGTLRARFRLPRAGVWELWLEGQFMPTIDVGVDGRRIASIAGQLSGNSLVPDTATPVRVRLSAGAHLLTVTRAGFSLAPGNGGAAVLDAAFLTPAGAPVRELRALPAGASSRELCSRAYYWVELVAG